MIRVRTPSRLHFGLLSLPSPPCWPNWQGDAIVPARRFGGAGLMVQAPGIELAVTPAPDWSADGPLAGRALQFARQFAGTVPTDAVRPQRIAIARAAPEHAGLGTGTQLGLAVARALTAAWGQGAADAVNLARRVGRGARSGLGVHGFDRGGFLIDAGKRGATEVAPLVARLDFPDSWRIVLIVPADQAGVHGPDEAAIFRRLGAEGVPSEQTDALCRLALLGLLPALVEHDARAFGEALYDFNARAGQLFAAAQGGTYATARLAGLVAFIRQLGVPGTGQSSWGPTVFAVTQDEDQAQFLGQRLRQAFSFDADEVLVTAPSNRGASVTDRSLSG